MVIPTAILSADSGAKTRLVLGETLSPSGETLFNWDWQECDKSQGSGDGVPRNLPPVLVIRFV